MKKTKTCFKKEFAKGFGLFCIFLCLHLAGAHQFCFALCFGLYVASMFCGVGVITSSVAYLVAGLFFGLTVFLWTVTSFGASFVVFLIYKLLKRKSGTRWFLTMLVLGQVFFVSYLTFDTQTLLQKCGYVLLSVVFAYVCLFATKSVFVRGLRYKLGGDEKVCIALCVLCIAMGLANADIFGFSLIRFVGGFCILFSLYIFGNFACMLAGVLFGLGCAFGGGVLADASLFACFALVAVLFRPVRALCSFALPLADIAVGYFFYGQMPAVMQVVSLLCGCLAFALVPKNTVVRLAGILGQSGGEYAIRNLVNRTKNNLSRKLYDLSQVFFEMKLSFSSMVHGVVPRDQAKVMLAKEVSSQVCKDCSERIHCWRTYIEKTEDAFLTIMDGALDRGKATVFDLPDDMTQRCKRLNGILSAVNQAVDRYKHYYLVTTNSDNSRLLISEQLAGVADILKHLSQDTKSQTIFDRQKESLLFETFARYGVLVKEVVVCQEKTNCTATIVADTKDSKKECIGKIVSRVCGTKMMLAQSQTEQSKTWTVLTFVPSPKFDVTFGFCATKKQDSKISGDTHSFLRIDHNRFLLGLCDGMGSGENAEKTSSNAISLIENFYKAGFDNETILSSVNRLLTLSQDETFTAVDISVVDLQRGLCDFIKIGATCGFVKNMDKVEIVSAGSLPLGVLEEMTPCITKKALSDGDVIIMVSDGISDAFETKENLAHFVADLCFKTPQQTADEIVKKALALQDDVAKDDMTVVALQVFDVTK